uniref:RRM domain-containing protein n=1 Tax=Meloidogyne enterolobii TaxID=390850 RepID=A0A6V7TK53_MELEN|nr:unnamed protein product [Meloidogyne enterolobii]
MEFASPPPLFNKNIYSLNNNKTPIFVFIVINEEENLNNSRNTSTTTNSSTPSSSLCSSSQDSAIVLCPSTSSSNNGDNLSPPPDPRQEPPPQPPTSQPTTTKSKQSSPSSFSNKQSNLIFLYLNWFLFDPLNNYSSIKIEEEGEEQKIENEEEEKEEENNNGIKQIKLNINNIFEKLNKLAKDLEEAYPDRNLLLVCNRRSLRQLLYPLCAQAFLAKLADEGEEQAFSARLPLPKLFHSFVPLFEELTFNTNTSSSSSSPFSLNNEKQQLTTKQQLFSTLNKEFVHFCQSFNNNNQQINKLNIEYIQQGYKSMLCTDTQSIDSKTIIRARGLPWQVSDLDVALFFAGLEIAKGGVILCLGPEGRRNGECLVKFETPEYRDWALERHRCHLRQRYIELYRSSADDFVRHAIGIDHCALNFAQLADQQSQQNFHQAMIVRMRGLPFSATEQQIRDFFSTDGLPSGILQEGVLFVQRPDGRPSGDAFVLFCDEQSGRRALLKHRQRMGTRYIELFRTTQAEVQQLFNSKQQIINAQEKNLGGGGILTNNNLVNNNQKTQTIITSTTSSASNGIINTLPPIFAPPINTSVATFIPFGKPTPPPFKNGRRRDCLRLRGLPYEAQVQQVVEFLGPHARHVLFQGVHMIYTSIGHPSGEAFIQMESEQAASNASQECHNKYMELGKKKRYIEVFQCCADDMSLHLNILQQSPPLIPPSAAPSLLPTPHSPLIPLPTNGTSPLFSLPATNPFLAAFAAATNVGAINEQTTNRGGEFY